MDTSETLTPPVTPELTKQQAVAIAKKTLKDKAKALSDFMPYAKIDTDTPLGKLKQKLGQRFSKIPKYFDKSYLRNERRKIKAILLALEEGNFVPAAEMMIGEAIPLLNLANRVEQKKPQLAKEFREYAKQKFKIADALTS